MDKLKEFFEVTLPQAVNASAHTSPTKFSNGNTTGADGPNLSRHRSASESAKQLAEAGSITEEERIHIEGTLRALSIDAERQDFVAASQMVNLQAAQLAAAGQLTPEELAIIQKKQAVCTA